MNTTPKQHWEEVYQRRSPLEVSWYQQVPDVSLSLIAKSTRGQQAAVIDVGAGASVLVDHLQQAGYRNISVLDISPQALAHARARLGAGASQVHWIEADVTQFVPAQTYDVWHDRAVFHFLTQPADRQRYVTTLKQAINVGGLVIIATFAIGGPDKCSGLDIVQYDAERLTRELGDEFELIETIEEGHNTPSGMLQRFIYFVLLRH